MTVKSKVVSLDDVRAQKAANVNGLPGSIAHAWGVYEVGGSLWRLRPSSRSQFKSVATKASAALDGGGITAGTVESWMNGLLRDGLAPATVNYYRSTLLAVVSTALRLSGNQDVLRLQCAVKGAAIVRAEKRRSRVPSREVLPLLESICENPAEIAFIRMHAVASLRHGEVLGLLPDDWDQERWRVTARRTKGSDRRKNRHDHMQVVDDKTAMAMAWTIAHHDELIPKSGWHRGQSRAHVFPWGANKVAGLMLRMRMVCPEAFPKGTAWHALRHLGATAVYELTSSVQRVQEHLGDATASAAMQYAAPLRGDMCTDLEAVAEYLTDRRSQETRRKQTPSESTGTGTGHSNERTTQSPREVSRIPSDAPAASCTCETYPSAPRTIPGESDHPPLPPATPAILQGTEPSVRPPVRSETPVTVLAVTDANPTRDSTLVEPVYVSSKSGNPLKGLKND